MEEKTYGDFSWDEYYVNIKPFYTEIPKNIDDYTLQLSIDYDITEWFRVYNWEDLDDMDLLAYLRALEEFKGELLIVTGASRHFHLGPLKINASHIVEFVQNHFDDFSDCFFDGDTIIISKEFGLIWIFHHEGAYALIKLKL